MVKDYNLYYKFTIVSLNLSSKLVTSQKDTIGHSSDSCHWEIIPIESNAKKGRVVVWGFPFK